MLTILILMAIFGGGSAEAFSRADFRTVESAIADPQRAEAATKAMERINDSLDALMNDRARYFEQLREIDARIESPVDEYHRVLDKLWLARQSAQASYVEEVFVLRDNMMRDEWETAFINADD